LGPRYGSRSASSLASGRRMSFWWMALSADYHRRPAAGGFGVFAGSCRAFAGSMGFPVPCGPFAALLRTTHVQQTHLHLPRRFLFASMAQAQAPYVEREVRDPLMDSFHTGSGHLGLSQKSPLSGLCGSPAAMRMRCSAGSSGRRGATKAPPEAPVCDVVGPAPPPSGSTRGLPSETLTLAALRSSSLREQNRRSSTCPFSTKHVLLDPGVCKTDPEDHKASSTKSGQSPAPESVCLASLLCHIW